MKIALGFPFKLLKIFNIILQVKKSEFLLLKATSTVFRKLELLLATEIICSAIVWIHRLIVFVVFLSSGTANTSERTRKVSCFLHLLVSLTFSNTLIDNYPVIFSVINTH